MATTGLNLIVYASVDELKAVKDGATMLIATRKVAGSFNVQVSVPLDACELGELEVRVNLALIKKQREELSKELGVTMGEAIGAELQKAMTAMTAEG